MAEISATIPLLMSFDLEQMLRSKKAFRDRLAARPIADKLRMLDALRERALAIGAAKRREAINAREDPPSYGNR